MEEAIEILRLFDTKTDEKMPRTHIVFGAYDGEIDAGDGERVVFIGDCATFHGDINGQDTRIESTYVDRSTKNIYEAESGDIFAKLASMNWKMFKHRRDQVIKLAGCPVSVAEQVLLLVSIGKLKDPYFDPSQIVAFNHCYFSSRTRTAIKRLSGDPYQLPGPVERGMARPKQNLPPKEVASTPLEIPQPTPAAAE